MNPIIEDILTDCAYNGIGVELSYSFEDKQLQFNVHIGSKTGSAVLLEQLGDVWIVGRYDRKEQLRSFRDLTSYAYGWYLDYADRTPFEQPDGQWAPIFEAQGFIEKVVRSEWKRKVH